MSSTTTSRPNGAASKSPYAGKRALSLSLSPAETLALSKEGGATPGVHPLRLSWLFWFVHRAAGTKVASATQYEESIKKIGGCSSIESLWTVYSHILPPSALPPVTDILLFSNTLRLPIWEECPNGAKFTLRVRKGISDRIWEDLVLAATGDQFDESDSVIGVVLSVRAQEDVISVWTEKAATDGGAKLKETIFRLLNLPAVTVGEYKLNSDLIQTTTLSSRPTTLERGLSRDVRRGNGNHASTPGGETGESTTSRDL